MASVRESSSQLPDDHLFADQKPAKMKRSRGKSMERKTVDGTDPSA